MSTDKSEQINELAAALSKAQSKFKHVAKDKTARIKMKNGGEYSYNYADLGSTWDVARGALTENGLSVVQSPSFNDGWLELTTFLLHASGQYISGTIKTRADDMDVKSIGSAITYLRRYAFSAMTGLVADEDDDGSAPNPKPAQVPARAHTNGSKPSVGAAIELFNAIREQGLKYRAPKMFKDMTADEIKASVLEMQKVLESAAPARTVPDDWTEDDYPPEDNLL